MAAKEQISITTAAAMLDISTATLREWDKKGFLIARRNDKGWRYYTRSQLLLCQEYQLAQVARRGRNS